MNKKKYLLFLLLLFIQENETFIYDTWKIYQWKETRIYYKERRADGLCVMRSFQEGLKICYQDDVTIEEVIAKLRSEVLHNYNFYSEFSSDEVNILTETIF